ncbi:MAG: STAS domain-containing protein [Proteobacteria bacterium]|nr:STAS domain-containing protein [Pseudomonadota bacterium]
MEITTRNEKNAVVVTVTGRMDAVTAPEFEKNLSPLLAAGAGTVVINFRELEYISSAGLRSILAVAKQLKAHQREMVITGLQGSVQEVFKLSGFYSIFKIAASEEEALNTD